MKSFIKIKSRQVLFNGQWLLRRITDLRVVRSAEAENKWRHYNKAMDDISQIIRNEIRRAKSDKCDNRRTIIESGKP